MATDARGVLRGKCVKCSACSQFTSSLKGIRCSCGHSPVDHEKLSEQNAGADTAAVAASHHHSSTSGFKRTDSSDSSLQVVLGEREREALRSTSHQQPLPVCKGCKKKTVYFDEVLGPFKYCSPECRDVDVLPAYNIKLKEFVDACSITTLQPHSPAMEPFVRVVELKRKAREEVGVLWSKTSGTTSTRPVVCGIILHNQTALKCFTSGKLKLFDAVNEIHPEPSKISLTVDGRDALDIPFDLIQKFNAKKHGANMLIAVMNKPTVSEDPYGFTAQSNFVHSEALSVASVYCDSPASSCDLKFGDRIVAYATAINNQLDQFRIPQNCDVFTQDVKRAYSEKKHLLLAIHRHGM